MFLLIFLLHNTSVKFIFSLFSSYFLIILPYYNKWAIVIRNPWYCGGQQCWMCCELCGGNDWLLMCRLRYVIGQSSKFNNAIRAIGWGTTYLIHACSKLHWFFYLKDVSDTRSPFYQYVMTSTPGWISNYIHCKMWIRLLIHSHTGCHSQMLSQWEMKKACCVGDRLHWTSIYDCVFQR